MAISTSGLTKSGFAALFKRRTPGSGDQQLAQSKKQKNLDLLRQLRAEVQDLLSLLHTVRDGLTTLSGHAGYLDEKRKQIDDLFSEIRGVLPDGEVAEGDDLRHLQSQWQLLLCLPIIVAPLAQFAAEEQVRQIALCEKTCEELIGLIGHLTIPNRLNYWLKDSWTGYPLPFHDLFSDELPSVERRQDLLKLLAAAPGLVQGGIVEPTSGLIFPYHKSLRAR